jgi:1-acyl-sn-glycerol-3-phosphate acyltransferase
VVDTASLANISGRPVLLLCNHQVDIESPLFGFLVSPLIGNDVTIIARIEHRQSWVGGLFELVNSYPAGRRQHFVAYLDRANPRALLDLLNDYRRGLATEPYSLMVHVEGELGLTCRQPVRKLASTFIDLSVELGLPIVPVRFVGGLPVEPLPKPIPFPVDFGRQDYVLGKPLLPEQLALLRHRERKSVVLDAINGIEPAGINEAPLPPQHGFAEAVRDALSRNLTLSRLQLSKLS